MIAAGRLDTWTLVLVATVANTLGSVFNWGCGRLVERYREARWFPATPDQLRKGEAFFARFGKWSLFFAWFPVGGDALTVIAGILRMPLAQFVAIVGAGKLVRYAAVALAAQGVFG